MWSRPSVNHVLHEGQKWYENSSGLGLSLISGCPGEHTLAWYIFILNQCRDVIMAYLKRSKPDAVKARHHRRFKHRHFYAAGVSDVWCLDQHDKWGPRFGLWLHNCIDPFVGFNNWLKVWWTNKNPRLIASYYLEAVQKYGGQLVVSPILQHTSLTFSIYSYSSCLSKWSRRWKQYCCKHSYIGMAWTRFQPCWHSSTPMEAQQDECEEWGKLVCISSRLHAWLWRSLWIRS